MSDGLQKCLPNYVILFCGLWMKKQIRYCYENLLFSHLEHPTAMKGSHAWDPVGCDESQSGRNSWTVEIQHESWDICGSITCNSKMCQQYRHCSDCNTIQSNHYWAERSLSFPTSDHMPSARLDNLSYRASCRTELVYFYTYSSKWGYLFSQNKTVGNIKLLKYMVLYVLFLFREEKRSSPDLVPLALH